MNTSGRYALIFFLLLSVLSGCSEKKSVIQNDLVAQIIFPYQEEHVHGSTIVELPNGDLITAWFQGSGERWADDVRIMGSRLVKGDTAWSAPFLMADVPGFPDINPILFLDTQKRLWLMWYPVLANQWETSIPMYRISENYSSPGAPIWNWQDVLFVKVGDKTERGIQPEDQFVKQVDDQLSQYEQYLNLELKALMPDTLWSSLDSEWRKYKIKMDSLSRGMNMVRSGRIKVGDKEESKDLGYPVTRRLGWQTKNKAVYAGNRLIVPLYSDGFDCSLFALSDDEGKTWIYSNPVLGGAGIQPTVLIGKRGDLTAYLRDNGPPPQRMQRTVSHDRGLTWSIAKDDLLPNPGAGFDGVTLPGGEWVMVFNDTENGRHNLSAALSDDEGKTWKWKKIIENDTREEKPTSSHYPSVIAGDDGKIHVSYSFHRNDIKPGRTVKYCSFTLDWLKEEGK
jgi:predicted neuraminidase